MTFWHYDLNEIVRENHPLRKIKECVPFEKLAYRIKECASEVGRKGYGLNVAVKCLFLQFYADLSDRQMEEALRDNLAYRWFCDFKLTEETPDHTFFCRMRKAIGTKRIGKLFHTIRQGAERIGLIGKVFTFADASAVKAKEATWEERDKALCQGEGKLNNDNVGKFSADPDARFGCKGKEKFWYGYKNHVSVDMREGLITKVAVTPANVPDWEGFRHICPETGMIFADKAYGLAPAQMEMKAHGCHSGAILRGNMKGKDWDKDRWLTKVRMPFEGIFSKWRKRTRYRGWAKVQLQAFLAAMVLNVKRLIQIGAAPLPMET